MAALERPAIALLFLFSLLDGRLVQAAELTGTVLHFNGSLVADAPIRARNTELGIDARTRTNQEGRFEFADLPAGDYVVSVNMTCCLFVPYVNDSVEVGDEQSELDIQLVAFNVDVEGDDPGTVNAEIARRQVIPDLPVPRMPDGKPDLSGVWLVVSDLYPEEVPALEWAQAEFGRRAETNFIDIPGAHCLPGGFPAGGGASFMASFVQRPEVLVLLFEDVAGFRQIFLDGREHSENPNPSWRGYSIGHWRAIRSSSTRGASTIADSSPTIPAPRHCASKNAIPESATASSRSR